MLRPLPCLPSLEPEPDDSVSGSFGGLADVLEPDPEATTSMRRVGVASPRYPNSLRGLALPPVSVRAPVQVQDFAFADTVFASEQVDDAEAPTSGPIFFSDDRHAHPQCVTPLAFPLPPPSRDVALPTRLRVLAAHIRHAIRGSRAEMREVWASTAEIVHAQTQSEGELATHPRFVVFLRRVLALWSCFQWSRADLTRAAMIGLGVFVVAGAIGATTMDLDDRPGSGAATSSEVRVGRTLDQHTARKIVRHTKR